MPRIVIAAGGTAGHVVPALAVAEELRASGAQVSFVGTRDRAEAELVPAAGYEIARLDVTGLDRAHPLRAVRSGLLAAGGLATSLRLLGRLDPDAVLAGGGYVAGPVGLAAAIRRVPLVLTEADSRLGLANRLLAPVARRVCLAFPIQGRTGERYLVTGRPVPRAIVEADRDSARERLDVAPDADCVLVFGGSLGARSLNISALEALAGPQPASGPGRPVVLHVAGRRDYGELRSRLHELGDPPHYRLYEYMESLADPLAAADLVLARAGGSVFELAAAGKPAVLVPYPHAAGGHQLTNARWMESEGAAFVIEDAALSPDTLALTVAELLGDPGRLAAMATAARGLAQPDAARRIADEVLAAANGERATARPSETRDLDLDLDDPDHPWRGRRLHFVGVGGAGMSGLALVARRLGAEVSGCDRAESPYTGMLREAGIEAQIGHSANHIRAGMEVVVSTAIPPGSPEVDAARKLGAPVIRRGDVLAEVAALRRPIAVAGTHGKTTTAAMAAHALVACGLDPSYLIGAELRGDGRSEANAVWGAGGWLIAEADESDRSFLALEPELAVVTNVELDHHTTFGSLAELEQAFRDFLARVPERGAVITWNRPQLRALAPAGRALVTFDVEEPGTSSDAHLAARDVRQDGSQETFTLVRDAKALTTVELPAPGRHNVLNALAALAACEVAGADLEQAARSLASFRPAGRRFEKKGEGSGVVVFDDYAHHPTEVAATLAAARGLEPRRLVAVFQPHLYSRTRHLYRQLGKELARADIAVVLDVYAARERPEGELAGVSGKLVADACADAAGGRPVWWLPTLDEAEAVLAGRLEPGDVVVTLGAGDVDSLAERLVARLRGGRGEQAGPAGGRAEANGG